MIEISRVCIIDHSSRDIIFMKNLMIKKHCLQSGNNRQICTCRYSDHWNVLKPIKTHNYLERVVTLLFLLWTTTTTITVSLLTGSVGWYWFLNVVSHQVKLSASHSRIWRRLWKYSRLVLAGMHHQSKLDPRKTSASLCWMGREFLANVKNIWKDLRNINIKQWAELSVC